MLLDVLTLLYVLVLVMITTDLDSTVNSLIRLPCQVMHALTSFADLNVFHCSGRDSECNVFLWTKL